MDQSQIQEYYSYFIKYLMLSVSIMFYSKTVSNLLDYRISKISGAITTSLMCFFTGSYCFSIFLTTLPFTIGYADIFMPANFIFGFLAYFFYCMTIQNYLKLTSKMFQTGKILILITAIFHILNFIYALISGTPLLTSHSNYHDSSLYFITCNLTLTPNLYGLFVGTCGFIGIILTACIVIRKLWKVKGSEKLLAIGIIITLIVSLNDTALGLGFIKYGFPLYFLGNALEAIRFSEIFKIETLKQIDILKSNFHDVAKVAQIGTIATSISHDIRNPLAIIDGEAQILKMGLTNNEDKNKDLINLSSELNVRNLRPSMVV